MISTTSSSGYKTNFGFWGTKFFFVSHVSCEEYLIIPIVSFAHSKRSTSVHERVELFIRDVGSPLLEFADISPNLTDSNLFEFSGKHLSRFIFVVDPLQFLVVL